MTGDDLLQPSIGKAYRPQRPIYTATAGYLTAFFGGPFAAVGMAGINAWRLGRLRSDAPALIGGVALAVGLIVFLLRPEILGGGAFEFSGRDLRVSSRALALLLFGGYCFLHRRYHRGMQFLGLEAPRPWLPALACIATDFVLTLMLIKWVSP